MSHFTSILGEQLAEQRNFVRAGNTASVDYRKTQLRQLKRMLLENEQTILEALHADLRKHPFEAYSSEIGFLYMEINEALAQLENWMAVQHVKTPIVHWPARSYILKEPIGQVLVISPWNYPIMLALAPAINALSAGNSVCLKPSELAPGSSSLLKSLVDKYFNPEIFLVVEGDGETLLQEMISKHKFDFIFYTGSGRVGKEIYKLAAEQLIPVVLELGGKSPCLVDRTAQLKTTARRIIWSKYWNAGQNCVSPDYLLVERSVSEELIKQLKLAITEFFGADPTLSPSYSSIIHTRHFHRIRQLAQSISGIDTSGWKEDSLRIPPVLVIDPDLNSQLMQEEIFGPLLPVITYETREEALNIIERNPDPLSFYVYSSSNAEIKFWERRIRSGGGVINGGLIHLANPELPFGGIGQSGFGSYHGKAGFETFSHKKSIIRTWLWPDIPLRYAPFGRWMRIMKRLMR